MITYITDPEKAGLAPVRFTAKPSCRQPPFKCLRLECIHVLKNGVIEITFSKGTHTNGIIEITPKPKHSTIIKVGTPFGPRLDTKVGMLLGGPDLSLELERLWGVQIGH